MTVKYFYLTDEKDNKIIRYLCALYINYQIIITSLYKIIICNRMYILGGRKMKGTIGERIKEKLSYCHMSQKELANEAEITEAAITHYIKGDRIPRAIVLGRIASALKTTPEYLLNGTPQDLSEEILQAKTLIARNVSQMSKKEKLEIMEILMGKDE